MVVTVGLEPTKSSRFELNSFANLHYVTVDLLGIAPSPHPCTGFVLPSRQAHKRSRAIHYTTVALQWGGCWESNPDFNQLCETEVSSSRTRIRTEKHRILSTVGMLFPSYDHGSDGGTRTHKDQSF